MRHLLIIISILTFGLLSSCENSNKELKSEDRKNTLTNLKSLFKYKDLRELSIVSSDTGTKSGLYKELDSTTFYIVWQDNKRKFIGNDIGGDYLYSWQNRDTNFIEFTILTTSEYDVCKNLNYFIYDRKGNAIDNFTTSSSCGDGGWGFMASGKFIDNRTFQKLCVEYEISGIDANNQELYDGDSTLIHFIINENGKVTQKEIYKKHFSDKKW